MSAPSSTPPRLIPVSLTWDGEEVRAPVAQSTGPRPSVPNTFPPGFPSPVERLPSYSESQVQFQRPRTNIRYSFSRLVNNAMIVLPPEDAQDTRPQYYITVSMNCFMPLSHITTVYRCANEHGPMVGEFEMGIIESATRLQIANSQPVYVGVIRDVLGQYKARDKIFLLQTSCFTVIHQ